MANFPTPVRTYNFSDARLVDLCIEKCAFAERDETELLTKGITDVWVADLLARALAFAAMPSDAIERAEQADATGDKDETADAMRDKVKELRSTAARTFGGNSGNYKKFDLTNIDKLRADELHTVALAAKGVAITYATELATKGWLAADNTELQNLCDAYVESRKTQNMETGDRDNKQEARVIEGNAIYDLLENQLCEAGKEYWRTLSAAKYNDYLIYDAASGGNPLTFSGTVTDNVTGALLADVNLIADGELITITNAVGAFSKTFTISEPLTVNLTLSKTGYELKNTTQQFTPGVDETQEINMQRIILATYQEAYTPGIHNPGPMLASGTGLRITLISGSNATVGLSNNGTTFAGNTETVSTLNQPVDRSLTELGGYAPQVLVQNNSGGYVVVRVDVLG